MILLALLACQPTEDSAAGDSEGSCSDAASITWDNYGEGLILEHCQPCHASETPERHGAPEDVSFDDHEQVLAWKERILIRSLGDGGMPPSRPLLEIDQQMLETWLTCWED